MKFKTEKLHFELLTQSLNTKKLLRVTNLIVKLFCFIFEILAKLVYNSLKVENYLVSTLSELNFYFFALEFQIRGWKIENFTSSNWLDRCIFILSLSSYEREVDKWERFLKYYSLNLGEPLKINTTPRFLRTSYNLMSCSCPGMLKIRSGMQVVSNRRESIISLFRGYIPLGSRDI